MIYYIPDKNRYYILEGAYNVQNIIAFIQGLHDGRKIKKYTIEDQLDLEVLYQLKLI